MKERITDPGVVPLTLYTIQRSEVGENLNYTVVVSKLFVSNDFHHYWDISVFLE